MHMALRVKSMLRGTLELLLLEALREGPLHGYAIARRIEAQTDDVLRVEEGSMYPALYRLEDQGLVQATWSQIKGRRSRVYRLTAAGRERLAAERRDWTAFSRAVTRMVGASK